MDRELVVAHYNEDLGWIDDVWHEGLMTRL